MSLQTATAPARAADVEPDVPAVTPDPHWRSLPRAFVHTVRSKWDAVAMVDSTGASKTYGRVLLEAIALSRVLRRTLPDGEYVGLLLPPTAPTAVANVAVALLGRVPVNLNYTAGEAVINSAIDQCGIKAVVTSKKALDRFKVTPKGDLVMLEDLPKKLTKVDKGMAFTLAKLMPVGLLGGFLPGLNGDSRDRTATVIFTSGSTGDPKGVVLTHGNVLSNIENIQAHLTFLYDEVVLGILPFFHSFGFALPLWAMLCLGKKAVYHFNPLDARIIGHLCQQEKVSLIVAAPTFARNYLTRCPDEQFRTVKRIVLGAEKLKPELAREIEERWGAVALEGYGTTELSPVVAVNVTHDLTTRDGRDVPGHRPGSVGRPIPGTAVKAVDLETGADLPRGEVGLISVRGPQVMKGYLNRPEATAKAVKDGWYATGDLGKVDDDGFLWITDRLSRFSKIGGEMVPHERVEAAIRQAAGVDESGVAVTALPDPKRGERLIVLHNGLGGKTPEAIGQALAGTDLPRLWHPGRDDFLEVEAIPMLGTGKLDLSRLRQIARERLPS